MKLFFTLLSLLFCSFQAYSQHTQWARNISGNEDQKGLLMCTDASGNLYLSGNFEGTVDFDSGVGITELSSAGLADIFILKMDPKGQLLWAKRIGGIDYEKANGMVLDGNDNLLISGYFYQTVDFDPNLGVQAFTSVGDNDIFVLKLDFDGNFLWSKQLGGIFSDFSNSIALNANEEIFICGQFEGNVDFDPGSGTNILNSNGGADIFALKLDATGNFVWANSFGNLFWDAAFFISVNKAGKVYLFGVFGGTVDFDPGLAQADLTAGGMLDLFMLKLDSDGTLLDAKQIGGDGNEFPTSVRFDVADNLYLTGYSDQIADLDPNAGQLLLTPIGGDDSFLAKYDSVGTLLWGNVFGGTGSDYAFSSTFNSNGEIYLIGSFQNTVDFDPGSGLLELSSAGASDIFVASFDSNGIFLDAGKMGADLEDFGYNIIIDKNDNMYTSGSFSNTVDLDWEIGELMLTSNGENDIFVCKLSPQPAPLNPIMGTNSICDSSTVGFSVNPVSGASNYEWILSPDIVLVDGQGTDSLTVFVTSSGGTLALTCSNSSGFSDTVYFNYSVKPSPVVGINVTPATTVLWGTSVTLSGTGATTYLWDKGVVNAIAFVAIQTELYTLIGEENGCFDTDSVLITVNIAGVQETNATSKIKVYPTLVSNEFSIDLPDGLTESCFEIHDALGKLILEGTLHQKNNLVSFPKAEAGVYVVSVGEFKQRLVKVD